MTGNTRSFRASYGLDAAGEKVINVALADKTVMTDGVNVEYVIQENTIQNYDPARGYSKAFAVMFNNRIWTSKDVIAKPAGPFNEGKWTPIRTDPKWYPIDAGTRQLNVGDYITIDTALGNDVVLTLPSDAQDGDNIVIKDIGGQPGVSSVIINAGVQSIIDKGVRVKTAQMTIPYSEWVFVYVNKLWNLYNGSEADLGRFLKPAAAPHQIQSGETIIRQYDRQSPIILKFPKHAAHGDMIHFVGMDNNSVPYFHLELQSFNADTSVISPGTKSEVVQRSLSGYFIYNSESKTWFLFDSDMTDRLRTVGSDTALFPNETVAVVGKDNTTVQEITLTLPQNVSAGDQITIALNHMRLGQTVHIVPSGTDKILTTKNLTQFPKRSSYPPAGNWENTLKLTYNGATDYPPVLTLAYLDMGPIKQWFLVESTPALERVDSTSDATKARLGVIALANFAQAQVDHEDAPNTDTAITPETLAKRVATEGTRGIAKIAKSTDVNQNTDFAFKHDLIITPKTLNEKTATETRRGVAEIATVAETATNTNDTHIVTPKKLDSRRATETLAGVSQVVTKGGTQATTRPGKGTGIFDFADHSKSVTPLVLQEWKASETQQGGGYLALDSEVIAGTPNPAGVPLIVTPFQLHKKTATESRIGFAQIATQAEVTTGTNDLKFITPLKLAKHISTETLPGLSKQATQDEFDSGTAGLIAGPDKIKTFFERTTRTSTNGSSGLRQSGNLWGTLALDIVASTEAQRGTLLLASQSLVNAGVDDTTAITPKKLQAKKATTLAEGIVRFASQKETVDGNVGEVAIKPDNLKYVIQTEKTWEAQTNVRGTVRISEGAITFVGNNTSGNTQDLELYQKTGYAISPYELNKTLANYAPLKSKAVDSDKLDGLDSLQFVRRDIDQTVNGSITLTKPLLNNDSSDLRGFVYIGNNTSTNNVIYPKFAIRTNILNAGFIGASFYDTSVSPNKSKFRFGYSGSISDSIANNTISFPCFDANHDGTAEFHKSIEVKIDTSVGRDLSVVRNASVGSSYSLGSDVVISRGTDPNNILFGNTSSSTYVRTADANNLYAQDSTSIYKILNQKNMQTLLNPIYVNKTGDSMSGRLNVSAPTTATIQESQVGPNNVPNTNNFGSWAISVTSATVYNLLPGYVVGVPEINNETGLPTGYIDHYDEFKGPGTLSQTGSSALNGIGTYQIWAPRPTGTTDGHLAQTFWTRQWNPVTNKWDGWGRMYTSNNPPTAKDIGAMSDNGSVFSSLKIRDWIQVGNLRIYADPVKKTVRFDWIE